MAEAKEPVQSGTRPDDKLEPLSFAICGCIDHFSRYNFRFNLKESISILFNFILEMETWKRNSTFKVLGATFVVEAFLHYFSP